MDLDKRFTVQITDDVASEITDKSTYESSGFSDSGNDITTTTPISVNDFTHNVKINNDPNSTFKEVTGDGIFDKMMVTATKHLQSQYLAGHIRGEDYATAYANIYVATLQTALQLLLEKDNQTENKLTQQAQRELIKAQILSEIAKKKLYDRQRKGFDEDSQQKILRHITELWSVAFSVAGINNQVELPNTVTSQNLEKVMRQVAEMAGIVYPPVDLSSK